MTPLKMLSADDVVAEIRRLYFNATKHTIQQDLARALDLLKSIPSEDERERAAVFMEGLAEMRKDWQRENQPQARVRKKVTGQKPQKKAPPKPRERS